MDHVFTYTQGTRGSHVRTGCRTGARCDTVAYLYISTTKTFITIPSTGATPPVRQQKSQTRQQKSAIFPPWIPCDSVHTASRTGSIRSDQEGNVHSLHAISSIPVKAAANQEGKKIKQYYASIILPEHIFDT